MDKIQLTEKQKEEVGSIVANNMGANFQTGRYAGHDDWVYIAFQFGPNWPTNFRFISPDGEVLSS